MDRGKVKGSPILTMIIQTILAMYFSILHHCWAWSLPSGFDHFQPDSARKIRVHVRGRAVFPCGRSAQLSADACIEQPRNSSEKVKFPCKVLYNNIQLSVTHHVYSNKPPYSFIKALYTFWYCAGRLITWPCSKWFWHHCIRNVDSDFRPNTICYIVLKSYLTPV